MARSTSFFTDSDPLLTHGSYELLKRKAAEIDKYVPRLDTASIVDALYEIYVAEDLRSFLEDSEHDLSVIRDTLLNSVFGIVVNNYLCRCKEAPREGVAMAGSVSEELELILSYAKSEYADKREFLSFMEERVAIFKEMPGVPALKMS